MKIWPVPDSYSQELPKPGTPGSFWDNREDRFHCGVDIYAPPNSVVYAIQSGVVIDVGIFTKQDELMFWNETQYVTIKTPQNLNIKYADLSEVFVRIGDFINAGQMLGRINVALNEENISHNTPHYVREMLSLGYICMLHLEAYIAPITEIRPYDSGNFFGEEKPYSLIDPAIILNGTKNRFSD